MLDAEQEEETKLKLHDLRLEHNDLDTVIDRLAKESFPDELLLRRLKKRKLQLKDTIVKLEQLLVPDILA
jgi:hypothetical protein